MISDEVCGADAVAKLEETLERKIGNAPKCFDGECTQINGNYFCRPGEHEFSMFVTPRKKQKLEGKLGKSRVNTDEGGSEGESKSTANNRHQLKTFTTTSIAGLSLIFTFFWTTRKFI